MKRIIFPVGVLSLLLLACTGTRRFGTTIERDEQNPCIVNMVLQIGIQGTDEDVANVKRDLEACYGIECFIPCPNDSAKGCKTKITIVVKKWGSLNEDEQHAFHYVEMVNDDGNPSTAYIGTPNAVPDGSCRWRRGANPGTYCHEVLHLCGLYDKYCARIYDPVLDSIIVERVCDPRPDPNGNCCRPGATFRRCTEPCPGHEGDIMGSGFAGMSCDNIMDVLKGAGFNNCPPECCNSNMTFTRPPDQGYILPGYLHFGDNNTKFGTFGVSLGYTKSISTHLGVTIETGIHVKSEKDGDIKQTEQLIHATGGITYTAGPPKGPQGGLTFNAHLMGGLMSYTQKLKYGPDEFKSNTKSFCLQAGIAFDLRLKRRFSIRLFQADYMPTFFYDMTQHNFRVGAGAVVGLGKK